MENNVITKTLATVSSFRARGLYRLLYKRLFLPRSVVHSGLSATKRVFLRRQVRQRNYIGRHLKPICENNPNLDQTRGFRLFTSADLPGASEAAAACQRAYTAYRKSGRDEEILKRNPSKRFLLSVISGNEFHAHPDLIRFMVSEPILNMASRYLGTVPVLEGAALWWTPPNDSVVSSQMVHIDELAPRQVKILLNCMTTSDEHGPLHLVPADVSEELRRQGRHRRGRLDDQWLEQPRKNGELYKAVGPPGSGVVFDSSRCLHFGSRGNSKDRLVLAFHFLPIDAPTETRYRIDPCLALGRDPDLSDLQKLALGFDLPSADVPVK